MWVDEVSVVPSTLRTSRSSSPSASLEVSSYSEVGEMPTLSGLGCITSERWALSVGWTPSMCWGFAILAARPAGEV